MTTEERHFSTFELDVYFASGEKMDERITRHLRACERCRRYVNALDAINVVPPGSLPVTRRHKSPPDRPAIGRVPRWMASAGAIAVFVVAAVWLMRTDDDTAYIASKGTPAVQVLLRTGDKTAIWDGKSPLHPGDALALRVACQGFARVAVVTPSAATEGLTRLTRGPCPASGASLPFSLVVDDAPGNERIAVVFSAQELEDRDLYDAMTREPRTKDVWVIKLTFQKVEGRRP